MKNIRKLALLVVIVCLMPIHAKAQTIETLAAQVNAFVTDSTTMTRPLTATIGGDWDDVLFVTGTATGVRHSLRLEIPEGITIDWRANYSGPGPGTTATNSQHLIDLAGGGKFLISDGSIIATETTATTVRARAIFIGTPNTADNRVTVEVAGGLLESFFPTGGGATISTNNNTRATIRVSGGIVRNASTGPAIRVAGPSEQIHISGGLVINQGNAHNLSTIFMPNTSAGTRGFTMTGGVVINTAVGEQARAFQSPDVTNPTIVVNISVNITGGFLFSGPVENSGIIDDVVHTARVAGGNRIFTITNAVAAAWQRPANFSTDSVLPAGTNANLCAFPIGATAAWTKIDGKSGILYSNADGSNKGFIEILHNLQDIIVGQYIVEVATNNPAYGSVGGGGEFEYGEEVTITATANSDHVFVNWTNQDGIVVSTDAEHKFDATRGISLTANFKTASDVLIVAGIYPANAGIVTGAGKYEKNEEITLTATAGEGYEFVNWTDANGKEISTRRAHTFETDQDLALVANFTLKTYTVSVRVNDTSRGFAMILDANGTMFENTQATFKHGDVITVRTQVRTSFFDETPITGGWNIGASAWWDDDGFVAMPSAYTFAVTRDVDLVAQFRRIRNPINILISAGVRPSGAGTIAGTGLTDTVNWNVVTRYDSILVATPNPGFKFVNWEIAPGYSPTALNAITLGATDKDTLNFSLNLFNVTALAVLANFEPFFRTVTLNPMEGLITQTTVEVGDRKTMQQPDDPTRENYAFGGWFTEENYTTRWNFLKDVVTSDTTLYARWLSNPIVITFNSMGGSDVRTVFLETGEKIHVPKDPIHEGHIFQGWYTTEDFDVAWNFDTDVVTSNTTLFAKWTRSTHTVTFNTQGGSEIDAQTINHGETVIKPADPTREAATFEGWYKEIEGINVWNFDTDVVTSDITLFAKWTLHTYTVTFNTQGGSAIDAQTIMHGDTAVRPTDPTRDGFTFGGWYTDSTHQTTWNFATGVISNITLFAKWIGNT